MKVLKYLAIIYVCSLLFLLKKTWDGKLCINSSIVQSIDIVREHGRVFYPNCYIDKDETGTLVLEDRKIILTFEKNLKSFEALLRQNGYFLKPNSLRVVIKDSANLSVSASTIEMNYEDAQDLKLVKKTLIKAWVLGFASKKIRDDKFTQEILSDVFLYVFWNKMNWDKETNFDRWLKYVYSEKDICTTRYIPLEHKPFCDVAAKSKKFDQISPWSLRPLVVNRILGFYDDMNLKEKLKFAKNMQTLIATYDKESPVKILNINNISSVYNSYMENLIGNILKIKFDERLIVDFIFEFDHDQPDSMIEFKSDLPFYMLKNIMFKYRDNAYINLRNGSKIVSKNSYANHWVLVQNSFPELKEVRDLPAEYLTIIQAKKEYDLSRFFQKMDDISAFPWVEEFDSLTIYIPSLKLLSKLAPQEVQHQSIKSLSLDPRLQEVLGWNPVKVY